MPADDPRDDVTADPPEDPAPAGPDEGAFALPEVTRGLRGLGSRRGSPGSDHDRFFAPLLAPLRRAREAAERAAPGWPRAAAFAGAFDPPRMAAELRDTLAALATERWPESAPDRRALEAELHDLAEETLEGLDTLGAGTARLRDADDDETREGAWRAWRTALVRAFAAADRCWLAALPALADSRGGEGRLWRRVLRRPGPSALLLAALGASLALVPARAAAQSPEGGAHVIVRVAGALGADSLSARALLRQGFDVIPGRDGELLVVADSADRARLEALGARTSVVRAPVAPMLRRARAGAPAAAATTVYRSFDDPQRGVRAFLDSLARASPRVKLDTVGFSFERRPILAVQIGQRDDAAARPNVVFMATYHAREWAATEMALRLARYLAAPPTPSVRLDSLLARRDVWVLPVANPDGYEYTFTADRLWRKNRRPIVAGDAERVGVDLNRNHTSHWGADDFGSSPDARSQVYRGPSAASEPEIQAIERWHAQHPPVVSVSYHTFAGLLLFPPGWRTSILSGDDGIYRKLAGTDEAPAVRDLLPGALPHGYQRPIPAWALYPTNGEYTDWASERFGTLAFTPELTSGVEGTNFYGFEFPDDEARLQRLFEDNLPFALDAIESAADPVRWASPTTGLTSPAVALESMFPRVRARVPAAMAAGALLRADGATLRAAVDTVGGGRYMRRVVGDLPGGSLGSRPREVTVAVARDSARFRALLAGGAEPTDSGWVASGFSLIAGVGGISAWRTTRDAMITSPVARVPQDVDTVTVSLWSRYFTDAARPSPGIAVRLSRDGGRTFVPVLTLSGDAEGWYPESRQVGGVRGAQLQLVVQVTRALVEVDEIAVIAHLPRPLGGRDTVIALRASENPVRGDAVRFNWPFGATAGDLFVYDFAGRLVWRTRVDGGGDAAGVEWPVARHAALANGVYVANARAGDRVRRQTG
jgi:hypothetical protein